MNQKVGHRRFTKQFKKEAVNQVLGHGYGCAEVARRLGVQENDINRWVRHFGDRQQNKSECLSSSKQMEAERHHLRKKSAAAYGAGTLKKGGGLLGRSVERSDNFIRQRMKALPMTVRCMVMQVSRSGFYRCSEHFKHGTRRSIKQLNNERIRGGHPFIFQYA